MPRRLFAALALAVLPAAAPAADPPAPPPGFRALFNGKDLSGWFGWAVHEKGADPVTVTALPPEESDRLAARWTEDAKKHWTVENGELVNDGHGAYLATGPKLRDIELLLEYKTVAKADSGVYLRGTPQVQIWDSTDPGKFSLGADKGSGGLWNNPKGAPGKDPLVKADKPFGEWNQMRILQVGARTTVHLNGKLVVDHAPMANYWAAKPDPKKPADWKQPAQPLLKEGAVLLQTHGGEIRWRNVFVRDIDAAEANKLLIEKAGDGFTPLFDGRSLAGWTGAVGEYEVKDGAIVCKPGKGGNLFTEKEFGDFVFQTEYKLPPKGNNGIAVRYPGRGDSAYSGMCEVQVLDDVHPAYAKIDPRQASGSVYGVIPAARGYQRPAGEWNVMTVTAKGSAIEVEVNGTVVTSGDVAKVKEYMASSKHPGLLNPKGRLGFAGHSDPVAFRNVRVKELGRSD